MEVTTEEYLKLLAEFNKNYLVSGFFGRVEIHFVDGKSNGYYTKQSFRQKDLEGFERKSKKGVDKK